jgi:hypothetical protein
MNIITFEFPNCETLYPKKIKEARSALIEEFKEEKNHPNLRKKLELISKAFLLFATQTTIEDNRRVGALQTICKIRGENTRMLAESKEQKFYD